MALSWKPTPVAVSPPPICTQNTTEYVRQFFEELQELDNIISPDSMRTLLYDYPPPSAFIDEEEKLRAAKVNQELASLFIYS